jgi:ketol-acid reductoisomerase
MAKTYYDEDTNLDLIRSKKVAIIGYGSQGHAHALNLKDSGVDVRVGLSPNSKTAQRVKEDGFILDTSPNVSAWADVIMILAPDTIQPKLYQDEISSHLDSGDTLMFSHGFNIRYGTVHPPAHVDVSMIAPKSPGHRVRETYQSGEGTPALLAIHQDSSGQAKDLALSYGMALGCTRAGVLETTFTEETETDLFGEQAVLCGGVSELVKAGFDTLVDAGYQPEIAYFECMHELKLIVDLMYRGGLNYMRYSISETAEYGDYESGPRVIDDHVRATMQKLLAEVQDGSFARKWIRENKDGQPKFKKTRQQEKAHLIEKVGRKLRSRMTFLDPVDIGD